jgi:hypothetical protein
VEELPDLGAAEEDYDPFGAAPNAPPLQPSRPQRSPPPSPPPLPPSPPQFPPAPAYQPHAVLLPMHLPNFRIAANLSGFTTHEPAYRLCDPVRALKVFGFTDGDAEGPAASPVKHIEWRWVSVTCRVLISDTSWVHVWVRSGVRLKSSPLGLPFPSPSDTSPADDR